MGPWGYRQDREPDGPKKPTAARLRSGIPVTRRESVFGAEPSVFPRIVRGATLFAMEQDQNSTNE